MAKSNSIISCNLFGYEERNISNSNYVDNNNYNMTPVSFMLNFTTNTSGIVQAGDTYISEFNSSLIELDQATIGIGYVKVTFNKDALGKYQQIYSYYNDGNTTLRDTALVQDVDLQRL